MAKLLSGKLPDPPAEYNQQQFNQIIRKLELVLAKDVEDKQSADDREAQDWFLSK
tara:strand:+ start:2729 stop:2893 length:165 start_codon:yes stop_codon:yes gene_type:complete